MFNKMYEKVKSFIKNNYKFLIVLTVLIFLFYYEYPYMIYKSGGTIDVGNRIVIDKDYKSEGTISMSYVTAMKGIAPFILLSYVMPDWDIVPLKEVTADEDYNKVIEVGKVYLTDGVDNAIISAFKESGYNINMTKEIFRVINITNDANTNIKIGDEIVSVNGKKIKTIDELRTLINKYKPGYRLKFKVIHDKKEYDRYATVYDDGESLKIGIAFKINYEYITEIPVSIKMKENESGSSGGLMMSLAIYNALSDNDITKGLNIVGTGTISMDGVVGEIGGVKYKVLAAEKSHADIFFCPEENLKEALNIKKKRKLKVEVVGVHTLKDAITYLENR